MAGKAVGDDIEIHTLPTRYGPMTVPATDAVIGRSLAAYGEWAQLEIDLLAASSGVATRCWTSALVLERTVWHSVV